MDLRQVVEGLFRVQKLVSVANDRIILVIWSFFMYVYSSMSLFSKLNGVQVCLWKAWKVNHVCFCKLGFVNPIFRL